MTILLHLVHVSLKTRENSQSGSSILRYFEVLGARYAHNVFIRKY